MVSFELGTISNYQYCTGIIFAGYTFGSGEAIVKGGRTIGSSPVLEKFEHPSALRL